MTNRGDVTQYMQQDEDDALTTNDIHVAPSEFSIPAYGAVTITVTYTPSTEVDETFAVVFRSRLATAYEVGVVVAVRWWRGSVEANSVHVFCNRFQCMCCRELPNWRWRPRGVLTLAPLL